MTDNYTITELLFKDDTFVISRGKRKRDGLPVIPARNLWICWAAALALKVNSGKGALLHLHYHKEKDEYHFLGFV